MHSGVKVLGKSLVCRFPSRTHCSKSSQSNHSSNPRIVQSSGPLRKGYDELQQKAFTLLLTSCSRKLPSASKQLWRDNRRLQQNDGFLALTHQNCTASSSIQNKTKGLLGKSRLTLAGQERLPSEGPIAGARAPRAKLPANWPHAQFWSSVARKSLQIRERLRWNGPSKVTRQRVGTGASKLRRHGPLLP